MIREVALAALGGTLAGAFISQAGALEPQALEANEVITSADIDQFCWASGHLNYLPQPEHRDLPPNVAEWAGQRRFVVRKERRGATLVIVPPPSTTDTRSAVDDLSQFFSLATGTQCPEGVALVRILSTGVQGLDIVTNEHGVEDFEFTP